MITIRADGSAAIGMGHLMRCLTIAEALLKQLHTAEEIRFLCVEEASVEVVRRAGFAAITLGTDAGDLEGELPRLTELFSGTKGQIFLVDSYAVTDAYLSALGRYGTVYLLDDLAEHAYPVDGVINYNLFADRAVYERLYAGRATRLYLGADYVPVREQFVQGDERPAHRGERPSQGARWPGMDREPKAAADLHLLLTTGGGDRDNIALDILRKLLEETLLDLPIHYHIVVGRLNPNLASLQEYARTHSNLSLHCDVQDMAALMRSCDLAVTAGGTTIYELATLGVPFVCFSYARNQEALTSWLGERNPGCYAGAWHLDRAATLERIGASVRTLCLDAKARGQVSAWEQMLIDGRGAMRIADLLLERTT